MKKIFYLLIILFFSSFILRASTFPIVHAYRSGASGIHANAYIVELQNGVLLIDATLSVSSAKEVRSMIDEIGKTLYAVLITHGHPDHYNGLTEITAGLSVPIYSTKGVLEVITRYDSEKEKQWKPTFGAEWPTSRTFPSKTINHGESLKFEGTSFTIYDLGAGESHSDSYWVMQTDKIKHVFLGDVVLHKVHAYLSDGHMTEWLAHLESLQSLLKDVSIFYPGHGLAGGLEILEWQKKYLTTYSNNLKPLWADKKITDEEKAILKQQMELFLPNGKLSFLIGLGAEPTAKAIF
jgi:glyoxylase-like metal-dependent hydrolase (beta-lactamase superfamily II)